MTTENSELLRRYVADRSESAFALLVERHIDLVYSAALRQVSGDVPAAQDVTQAVFCDLARQARRLTRHPSLTGWLYTSTRYLAAKTRRTEQRRRTREQLACAMNQPLESPGPDPDWQELRPVLDDAMHDLNATDRDAVLMRYFEERPLAEIGARLGLTENAARMRVDRAMEKLRTALAKRGVSSTAVALAVGLAQHAVNAAPSALTRRVSQAALAAGATGVGGSSGLTALVGAGKAPLWIGGAVAGLIAIGIWLATLEPSPDAPELSGDVTMLVPEGRPVSATPIAAGIGRADGGEVLAAIPGDALIVDIVTADTGQPVPGAQVECWLWAGSEVERKTIAATRFGQCTIPVPRAATTQLILVSQCDGFADTRLAWRPDRGEAIPDRYTLKVARSLPIGGRVVDSEGQPVAGAQVGFGNRIEPALETRPQSDNFDWPFWVKATTDADGRWRIDRIAAETIKTIEGGASHPEHVGSEHVSVSGDSDVRELLLDGQHVFKLGRAVIVRGVVMDADGKPLQDAKVAVGPVGHSGRRESTTAANGTFLLVGCPPGRQLLSAEAPGYAPTTREVELTVDTEPFQLTLAPGKRLRLRVVNSQGLPIPQASVWLDTFGHGPWGLTGGAPSVVQADFNGRTDADGRVEWNSAPDQELHFDIAATGYMRNDEITVLPDGIEHEIVLTPALTISGTVTDERTGEPIPRFRIITGWPNPDRVSGTMGATWSDIDRFWLSFEGGQFQHVYEEPVLGGVKEPAFVFKFEAEGYAPLVTRTVLADEIEARFDVRLRAASATTVTVFLPDGTAAARADIGLISSGARLEIIPGGLGRRGFASGGSLLLADGQGQFRLPPDDAILSVIVAHPGGFTETTTSGLIAEPVIRLHPWVKLEGTYLFDGVPTAGHELLLEYGQGDRQGVSANFAAYCLTTGQDGKFSYAQVPPGRHLLVLRVEAKGWPAGTDGRVWRHQPLCGVDIRPGETTILVVDGATDSSIPGKATIELLP
jgi:RNA polymerase sigma factor (sigma-70 family)